MLTFRRLFYWDQFGQLVLVYGTPKQQLRAANPLQIHVSSGKLVVSLFLLNRRPRTQTAVDQSIQGKLHSASSCPSFSRDLCGWWIQRSLGDGSSVRLTYLNALSQRQEAKLPDATRRNYIAYAGTHGNDACAKPTIRIRHADLTNYCSHALDWDTGRELSHSQQRMISGRAGKCILA